MLKGLVWSTFGFLSETDLSFYKFGTILLLMTFLDPCPGLRDIVFGSR